MDKKPITELKSGDQVRVAHLPPDKEWCGPPGGRLHLQNGDLLILGDPPLYPVDFEQARKHTREDYVLHYFGNVFGCWIPYEWVDGEETSPVCTCNIMVTGCICGVFQKEQQAHE